MATARDKALAEIAKLPPEARKYLTALANKSNAMNQRSMGSGDEYVKGQVRASQGKPKRVTGGSNRTQGPPAPKKTGAAAKKTVGRSGSPSAAARTTSRATRNPASVAKKTTSSSKSSKKNNRGAISGSVLGSAYRQFERMEPGRSISKLFK